MPKDRATAPHPQRLEVGLEDQALQTARPQSPTTHPKDSQPSGSEEEDDKDADISLGIAREALWNLIKHFPFLLRTTLLIVFNSAQATFSVTKGIVGVDFLVFLRVSSVWLRFALHIFRVLRFVVAVIGLKISYWISEAAAIWNEVKELVTEEYETWGMTRSQLDAAYDNGRPLKGWAPLRTLELDLK